MQFARANTCPKITKEYVLPTHGQKDNAGKMKDELTEKINNETLTSGIKHWYLAGYSRVQCKKPTHKQESGKPQPHAPIIQLTTHLLIASA